MAAVVLGGCGGGDGRTLAPPKVPAPTTTTTTPIVTAPSFGELPSLDPVVLPSLSAVVLDRLSSPAPAIALAEGFGARPSDPVTVDGSPADVVAFDVLGDGSFEVRVAIPDEGAHTVCVAEACGRVYTLAADSETPEEVRAKIDEAIPIAQGIVPADVWFPDWTIEVGGLLSGTGGSTDAERSRIVVYRNRGRTVDDFVRTIVHEYGHVADAEWLTDELRAEFAALRGFDSTLPWDGPAGRAADDWFATPAEDFAEVMTAVWSGDQWAIRTDGGPLTDEVLAFADALIGANT